MQEGQAQVQSVLLLTDGLANERIKSKDGRDEEATEPSWLNGWQEGEGGGGDEWRESRKRVVSGCDRLRPQVDGWSEGGVKLLIVVSEVICYCCWKLKLKVLSKLLIGTSPASWWLKWGRWEITNCRFRSYLLLLLKIEIEGTGGDLSMHSSHQHGITPGQVHVLFSQWPLNCHSRQAVTTPTEVFSKHCSNHNTISYDHIW